MYWRWNGGRNVRGTAMKIGILETGEVHEDLVEKHGDYPSMFVKLLQKKSPAAEFFIVRVCNGDPLGKPGDADGWIITGSRHGVYDDLPWIEPLKVFLRESIAKKIPVAGICFGHQILAEAMGGKAEKSSKGWGLGVHKYAIKNAPAWLDDVSESFTGHALHQDQVTEQPPNTTVIASSDFCELAALVYGDLENPDAISVQPHPEFSSDFVGDLIDVRLSGIVPEDVEAQARNSLGQPVHNEEWGGWINQFLAMAARK